MAGSNRHCCDYCTHYQWYKDYCTKWDCEIDCRSICSEYIECTETSCKSDSDTNGGTDNE